MDEAFFNRLAKWAFITIGPPIFPLVYRWLVEQPKSLDIERFLFIAVLAATGLLEVIFGRDPDNLRRTVLIAISLICATYGLAGYGKLADGLPFAGIGVQWEVLTVLVTTFLAYRWRVLRDIASQGS